MYPITTTCGISGTAYSELIAYLTRQCDTFYFHLPNMGKMLVNERNAPYFPEYPIGYNEVTDEKEHLAYVEHVQPLVHSISNDITKQWKDTGYHNQISNTNCNSKLQLHFTICLLNTVGYLETRFESYQQYYHSNF